MSLTEDTHARGEARRLRGLVVSDLHLFAHRSSGFARFEALRGKLAELDLLVLNGDTFDFRWSTLAGHPASVAAALEWLHGLMETPLKCRIHFVYGNHDCLEAFRTALVARATDWPRFHVHQEIFRCGSGLFLHGDCATSVMDARLLAKYRATWEHDPPRGVLGALAYTWADRLGFTRLGYHWQFSPRRRAVQRVAHYLDQARPGWREQTRHCYFGHTHLPFSNYARDGIRFHNTGSAIRGMPFRPIFFEVPAENVIS